MNFSEFRLCDDSDRDKEMKTMKTFLDVANEIGGFDRWAELPTELKTLVVSHLSYLTRTRLSLCSKQDYEVVSSCPIQLRKLKIKDNGDDDFYISQEPIENVIVGMEFRDDERKIYLNFIKRENNTEIGWIARPSGKKSTPKFVRLEGRNHYDEAVKFIEKRLKQAKYNVEEMTVEMKEYPFNKSGIKLLKCERIRISDENDDTFKWWLERVHPNLKSLELSNRYSGIPFSSDILAMDHIKLCECMYIWGHSNFTNEQFLSFKAFRFSIVSNTITDEAINTFIRKWVNGEIHKNFRQFDIWMNREKSKDDILKNVHFRPWDEEFVSAAGFFTYDWERVMGRGDCNQISKEDGSGVSATLSIGDGSVSFSVTGRRINYNGREYTSYGIPSEI